MIFYRRHKPNAQVVAAYGLTNFSMAAVHARALYDMAKSRWEIENPGFHDAKSRYGFEHIRQHNADALLLCWLFERLGPDHRTSLSAALLAPRQPPRAHGGTVLPGVVAELIRAACVREQPAAGVAAGRSSSRSPVGPITEPASAAPRECRSALRRK